MPAVLLRNRLDPDVLQNPVLGLGAGSLTPVGQAPTLSIVSGIAGDLTFTISPDHASVTNYQIRIRLSGTASPILTAIDIGKPTPVGNQITWNIATELTALGDGDYEVTVATTTPGGTTDSGVTNAFSVPLVAF